MCLFKKKKKIEIETKFKVGDSVIFTRRGELTWGWIYKKKLSVPLKYIMMFKSVDNALVYYPILKKKN